MDLAAEAGCLVLEAIDRVADIIVDSHRGLLGSWNWREKSTSRNNAWTCYQSARGSS